MGQRWSCRVFDGCDLAFWVEMYFPWLGFASTVPRSGSCGLRRIKLNFGGRNLSPLISTMLYGNVSYLS